MQNPTIVILLFFIIIFGGCNAQTDTDLNIEKNKSNDFWKQKLSPLTYYVTREKGTEKPFSGKYWNNYKKGKYYCICCGQELFNSKHKFKSGTGWPSFYNVSVKKNIKKVEDYSNNMIRTEIQCSNCNAHLGHLFNDGPKQTGLRYCINSCSLIFKD